MKEPSSVKLILGVALLLTSVGVSAQAIRYCQVKFRETGIRISQYNDGYFQRQTLRLAVTL
jgi:hypothetical protein